MQYNKWPPGGDTYQIYSSLRWHGKMAAQTNMGPFCHIQLDTASTEWGIPTSRLCLYTGERIMLRQMYQYATSI